MFAEACGVVPIVPSIRLKHDMLPVRETVSPFLPASIPPIVYGTLSSTPRRSLSFLKIAWDAWLSRSTSLSLKKSSRSSSLFSQLLSNTYAHSMDSSSSVSSPRATINASPFSGLSGQFGYICPFFRHPLHVRESGSHPSGTTHPEVFDREAVLANTTFFFTSLFSTPVGSRPPPFPLPDLLAVPLLACCFSFLGLLLRRVGSAASSASTYEDWLVCFATSVPVDFSTFQQPAL
mmetsp:Transcript_31162/g.42601  ORF Transcript_31162/g.42601 Transcript_31162/m.42601 type:complete len:234 (+) Transcript_31162:19-720(+)